VWAIGKRYFTGKGENVFLSTLYLITCIQRYCCKASKRFVL
jgi:hypothetical protein